MSISFKGKADEKELVALVQDMVRINSINPFAGELGKDGEGEAGMIEYLSRFFDKEGIPYTLQEVLPGRCNLVACLKGSGEGALAFEAHIDTVTVDGMTIDPFDPVVKDGKIYGRGSCDDKGSVAAMAYSLAMMKRMGITPACDVYFVGAADEEYAYRGVLKFLEDGKKYAGAVIGEPTDLKVCIANKGVIRFFITARGVPAHSSTPWLGHSALFDMTKLIMKIENELKPRLQADSHPLIGPRTISITTINGGELVNIIPDFCQIQLDVRALEGDTFEWLAGEIQKVIDELKAEDPAVDITIEPAYLEDQAMVTPADADIVKAMCAASDKILGGNTVEGLYCGCDATKFHRAGTRALVFGPGSMHKAHTVDEYLDIDQLALAAEAYAQLCVDFCP